MSRNSTTSVDIQIFDPQGTYERICDNNRVGLFLATTWHRYFSKYTPMQNGILRDDVDFEPFKVIYKAPYAHYQWEGKLYVSPSTGSPWARPGEVKVRTERNLEYSTEQNPLATSHWEKKAYEAFRYSVSNQVSEFIRRQG